MACATSTACSPSRSSTGSRSSTLTPGWQDRTPWEFPRPGTTPFASAAPASTTASGRNGTRRGSVEAKALRLRHPGHGTDRVSTLRLWKAGAPAQIDLNAFNSGDYARAAEFKNRFENISWVLYPNDSTPAGRELRLRQEYFFVSASLQDILFHHLEEHGTSTTSPTRSRSTSTTRTRRSAVAELMRLLVRRITACSWAAAWSQCRRIFSYTNHTLMPEALETWPVSLIHYLLPRHMRIIYRINQEFLAEVEQRFPGDIDLIRAFR
jgi:starch phosphorylase